MDWKSAAVTVIALVLVASVLALPAAANGDDWGKGWGRGRWDKWDDWDDWDDDWFGRGPPWARYPVIAPGYPVAYPVAYPAFAPASFGYDQGACFQACVNPGYYSPAQCGQMCYYA